MALMQHLTQWVPRMEAFVLGYVGRGIKLSEDYNMWSFTSTHPHTLMTWCLSMHRDSFTSSLTYIRTVIGKAGFILEVCFDVCSPSVLLNPYPANVDNMASSYQC